MMTQHLHRVVFKTIPPVLLALGLTSFACSHATDSTVPFLAHIAAAAFFEMFWSSVMILVVASSSERPGIVSRIVAWATGLVGWGLTVSVYMIMLLSSVGGSHTGTIASHDIVAFSLVALAWVIGLGWGVLALTSSVRAGDWGKTVWARSPKRTKN